MDTQAPTAPLTRKGERTRQHILDTALALFASKGYQQTTLREIAAAADCSLGLTYRYFTSKEEMVLALYRRLTQDLSERLRALPPAPLSERFVRAMRLKLELLTPYRAVLGALFGAAVDPASSISTLREHSVEAQQDAQNLFELVVACATDAPPAPQAEGLATLLYSAHLALLLFWLHDRNPESTATDDLVTFAGQALALAGPLMGLEEVAAMLERLTAALGPVIASGL